MSTFSEFITKLEAAVDNKNARTTVFLKEETIRQLQDLSQIRTAVMEDDFSFTTTANQAEYTAGHSGFPVDVMEFDAVYAQIGTGASAINYPVEGPLDIEDIRRSYFPNSTHPRPYRYAWHHQTMILSPTVSTAVVIKGDYLKDATRDSSSGALITEDSTTHTNPWFSRGEKALMSAVLAGYFKVIAKDPEAALFNEDEFNRAMRNLKRERTMRSFKGGQAPNYFFSNRGYRENW